MHRNALGLATAWPLGAALCGLLCAQGAVAQQADAAQLPAMTVRSVLTPTTAEKAPASVTVVDGEQLRERQWQVNLSESLGNVPGLLIQNRQNYAQDLQMSIRGHGARSTFGVRGIQVYLDGIPATMPDGQGQTNHIDLSSLERLEVLRGPYSTLYGNASGGAIQAFTERGEGPPKLSSSFAMGSNGQKRLGLKASGERAGVGYTVSASRFLTDGYRPQTAADKNLLNARLDFGSSADSHWTVVASHVDIDAKDAGGVTPADWAANHRAVAAGSLQYNTRKSQRQTQAGLIHEHRVSASDQLRLMVYGGHRAITQYQSIPKAAQAPATHAGGVIDMQRDYGGLDARWTHQQGSVDWVLGLAANQVRENRKGYENFVGSELGIKGNLRRDERNRLSSVDPYAQASWAFAPAWTLDAGLRWSNVRFDSRDRYIVGANGDDSGKTKFHRLLPMASLQHAFDDATQVYASVASGFETPTFNELSYRQGGLPGLNFALRPARSTSAELGLRQRWRGAHWHGNWSAALFRTGTKDEIVVATNSGGRSTYQNAGRTRRQGVELASTTWMGPQWRLETALTLLDARLRDGFCNAAGANCVSAGNRLAGTARYQAFAGLYWQPAAAWNLGLDWRQVGPVTANDANSVQAPGYGVASLSGEYVRDIGAWAFKAFARVDNLLDRQYVGSVIVNEGNGRYYEAAPGRQWMAGVSLAYRF